MAKRPGISGKSEAAREADQLLKQWRQRSGPAAGESPNADRDRGEEQEDWVVSYMDMVTLLMTVFLGMMAIQGLQGGLKLTIVRDSEKETKATFFDSILDGGAPNIIPMPTMPVPKREAEPQRPLVPNAEQLAREPRIVPPPPAAVDAPPQQPMPLSPQAEELAQRLGLAGLGTDVVVTQRPLAVAIEIRDKVLFAPGQAELTTAGRSAIARVAPALKDMPGQISVEGHTDDVPISSPRFASNWELSAARATSVLKLLLELGFAANRLRAIAYADTKPIASGVEGRVMNRRVTLTVGE